MQLPELREWPACWIWPSYPGGDLLDSWAQFRKVFVLNDLPKSLKVRVTADQYYRLYVNGQRVLDGPARGFQEDWFYDEVEIAQYLKSGNNVIGAVARNPGIGHHSYIHEGFAGFFLWGTWEVGELFTDSSWQMRHSPVYLRNQTRTSIQTGWQEFYDATAEDGDWLSEDYDASHWPKPSFHSARPAGSPPWHRLSKRDIPLLREAVILPRRLVASGELAVNPCRTKSSNVVLDLLESKVAWRPCEFDLAEWIPLPEGKEDAFYLLDLEREVFATTLLEFEGIAEGAHFDVCVTEGLDGTDPMFFPEEGCQVQFGFRYTCSGGNGRHESFQPWGYRYLVVAVRGLAGSGGRFKVACRHREYPLSIRGSYKSSNERLNEIHAMCVHTQLLCMSDTFVDCPGREQAMWWGDAHCHFDNSKILGADDRIFERGIRLIGRQTTPNGLTYSHAPTKAHECVLPDFTLAWIQTLHQHWWFSGSATLFREQREVALAALEYFHSELNKDGLLPWDRRYWLFLDWAEVYREGVPSLYCIQYYMTLCSVVDLMKEVDDSQLEIYIQRRDDLKNSILETFWDKEREVPYDGITHNGEAVASCSLHVRVFCILADLWPEYHGKWLNEDLVPFVLGPRPKGDAIYAETDHAANPDRSAPTPYFMQFVFKALEKLGRTGLVLDCIERWWGDMIDRGLVATEEAWDAVAGLGSLCHAWTAHPIQFLASSSLGIRQTAPGWTGITFSPNPHCEKVKGKVDTPLGEISVNWDYRGGSLQLALELPEGCKGSIAFNGYKENGITGSWSGVLPVRS
ncbi:hypothetical protein H5P27_03175 [Pelagicoccus albus]|uniref:Alpha-L-rhamnosidase n=2 Tax=Pelagicoccus albus TaxID=415222 RepID=A0A7X1B3M9_9BACT|nr:alpha-L-rhamnosidase C-terminal domain-containing protein [Pelagicoccus albus]MBC2605036.1 hypothetical protein [Pelagicoccus albus]